MDDFSVLLANVLAWEIEGLLHGLIAVACLAVAASVYLCAAAFVLGIWDAVRARFFK